MTGSGAHSCAALHAADVDTSDGSAVFGRALNFCLLYTRKNGLTTELLTENRGRKKSIKGSPICLFVFWDAILKTNNFL